MVSYLLEHLHKSQRFLSFSVKGYKPQFSFAVLVTRLKRYIPALQINLVSVFIQECNGDESKKRPPV